MNSLACIEENKPSSDRQEREEELPSDGQEEREEDHGRDGRLGKRARGLHDAQGEDADD